MRLFLLWLLIFISTQPCMANEDPPYDEVTVLVGMKEVGQTEMEALLVGEQLYLPVEDVFNFLKIRNIKSVNNNSISGFLIKVEDSYLIDKARNGIEYKRKFIEIPPGDMLPVGNRLYLQSAYFGKIFGLECHFNFRSLSVQVSSSLDLPVIREMRLERLRKNKRQLTGEVKPDTTIEGSYSFLKMGAIDWSVVSTQNLPGGSDTRINLALGMHLAGGEAMFAFNHQSHSMFQWKQQLWYWRYVNNEYPALRQISIGKLSSNTISSVFSPFIGVQFTNQPTTLRKSFGTYILTDKTEPGWSVELYINNSMIDYTKADAAGMFSFEVPLIYGNSSIELRYYGLWGEEKTMKKNINVPYGFLPRHQFEYSAAAGILEDGKKTRFLKLAGHYGIRSRMTIGAGVEYLSSITKHPFLPFVTANWTPAANLLITAEYSYGLRAKGLITYRLPSNFQVDINYSKYEKGQTHINTSSFEERRFSFSLPVRHRGFFLFSKLTINQLIRPIGKFNVNSKYSLIPKRKTTGMEWLFSATFRGLSANLTTTRMPTDSTLTYTFSNLSIFCRLPAGFLLRPQVQYAHEQRRIMTMRYEVEKQLSAKGVFSFSYEKNFTSRTENVSLGFRFDLSFVKLSLAATNNNNKTQLSQSLKGSLFFEGSTPAIQASNRNNVGKGGVVLLPFLDLNGNGKKELDEPKFTNLNFRIKGGRMLRLSKDSLTRIIDLTPFTNYVIEIDPGSLTNIAWQIKNKKIAVSIEPNLILPIEIPISVMGEVSGRVSIKKDNEIKGLSRIVIGIYDAGKNRIASILSESDGVFNFLGLLPGTYVACIDDTQLQSLQLSSSSPQLDFTIPVTREGAIIEGLEFILTQKQ